MLIRTILDNSIHINALDSNMIKVEVGDVLYNHGEFYIYNGGKAINQGKVDKNGYFSIKEKALKNGYRYDVIIKLYLNDVKVFEKISYIIAYKSEVEITNIPTQNIIEASKFAFNGSFKSSNDIVRLKSYQFFLYDNEENLIQQYTKIKDLRYANTNKLIQYVKNLETDKTYYVKMVCVDEFDVEYETEMYKFTTDFIPYIANQACGLINECHTGSVQINSTVKRLLFIGVNDWNYIANEEIDLTRSGYIYMQQGFEIFWDFTMEFYCRNIILNKDLIYLKNKASSDYLRCWYDSKSERIYVEKKVGSYIMLYRSVDILYVEPEEEIKVMIQHHNGRIGINVECILEPEELETVVYGKQKILHQTEVQEIL